MMTESQMNAMSKLALQRNLPREEMLRLAAVGFPHFSKEEQTKMVDAMLSDEYPPLEPEGILY